MGRPRLASAALDKNIRRLLATVHLRFKEKERSAGAIRCKVEKLFDPLPDFRRHQSSTMSLAVDDAVGKADGAVDDGLKGGDQSLMSKIAIFGAEEPVNKAI